MAVKATKSARPRKKGILNAVRKVVPDSPEINLKKLARSTIPMNFVKKHQGQWDHATWLGFLEEIKKKGYYPVNEDQVGLVLEQKKAVYFEKQKSGC